MGPADWVLMCALELLGQSPEHLPRIAILPTRPPEVSAEAAAFVNRSKRVIYLIAPSPAFEHARSLQTTSGECRGRDVLQLIASMIVHELWHLRHGPDEENAYAAQMMALKRLGVGADRWQYRSVVQGRAVARTRLQQETTRDD